LDSTFTERDYGASTFRDFIEKMASAGYVNLKQVDRSLLVELKDRESVAAEEEEPPQPGAESVPPTSASVAASGSSAPAVVSFPSPAGPTPAQLEEGVRALFDAFQNAKNPPHWPMYLRNVKQYVKNAAPSYDERRYGFANFLEAVRAAGRAGLFRLERNRQGILRIFAGNQFPRPVPVPVFDIENELAAAAQPVADSAPVVEEEVAAVIEEPSPVIVEELPVAEVTPEEPKHATRRRARPVSTSSKKKPSPSRKTRKKTGTDSEPI
jgi:hypothetical protein